MIDAVDTLVKDTVDKVVPREDKASDLAGVEVRGGTNEVDWIVLEVETGPVDEVGYRAGTGTVDKLEP